MGEKVRVGIIGTSWWADMMYLPSLQSHPQAEIAAICGRNRERAEEMASKYAIPQVFTDYQELIDKGGVQALVVATPDDLHHPITMTALDAGLHVLCEKPMALNAQHAREMYEKAEERGIKHMILFTSRWLPHFRYVKELIDDGYIGRCFHCHLRYLGGQGRQAEYHWRADRRHSLGILGDLGSHMIDRARWYVGEIDRVSAHLSTFIQRPGAGGETLDPANDSALLTLEFENGAQGTIHVSAVAHMGERVLYQQVALYGESGTLEVDYSFAGRDIEIRGARHDEEQMQILSIPAHLLGGVNPDSPPQNQEMQVFARQPAGSRLFIDAILEDQPISPDFRDGLKVQEVIDAAIEADQRGCWVRI